MVKAIKYQKILADYLQSIVQDWTHNPDEEAKLVIDQTQTHFLVVFYGWTDRGHLHSAPIHLEIRGGKVWIQENLTEIEIDDDLVALGIPKSEIVLGVVPPEYRKYSEYAVA